jgi:hypothetical protein
MSSQGPLEPFSRHGTTQGAWFERTQYRGKLPSSVQGPNTYAVGLPRGQGPDHTVKHGAQCSGR